MNNLQKILISIAGIITISLIIYAGATMLPEQQTDEPENNDNINTVDDELIAAAVNGVNITYDQITSYQESYMQQGQNISEKQALEQLINQEVLRQAAQQEQYIPSTQEAEQQLESLLLEQNLTLENYKQQLQSQGISYDYTIQNYILQLTIQNYLADVLDESKLNVSDLEAFEYYQSYQNQSQEEVPSYEELKEQIVSYLKQQKRQQEINVLIQDLRDEFEIIYY